MVLALEREATDISVFTQREMEESAPLRKDLHSSISLQLSYKQEKYPLLNTEILIEF